MKTRGKKRNEEDQNTKQVAPIPHSLGRVTKQTSTQGLSGQEKLGEVQHRQEDSNITSTPNKVKMAPGKSASGVPDVTGTQHGTPKTPNTSEDDGIGKKKQKLSPHDFRKNMKSSFASTATKSAQYTSTVASPSKKSQAGPKSHKLYVAMLESGELIAYVVDRYNPSQPGFISNAMKRVKDDEKLTELTKINLFLKKRSPDNPHEHWSVAKQTSNGSYSLSWYILVRVPEEEEELTIEKGEKWGKMVAKVFTAVEAEAFAQSATKSPYPNSYQFAGCIHTDKDAVFASDFFTTVDVMNDLILPAAGEGATPIGVCKHEYVIERYYGADSVDSVTQLFCPAHLNRKIDAEEKKEQQTSPNQGLYDLCNSSDENQG